MKHLNSCFCFLTAAALLLVPITGCSNNDPGNFSYSDSIDDNGYWKGVTALDYVELFDYNSFTIPNETHNVSDDTLQKEINALLDEYAASENVTNRAVKDGDTVNIDYVGTVDGVAFDNGSTDGNGTEVIIGETVYIDDFLEQLIGHNPGETFEVHVTFPEDYGKEDLNGKDAVFTTTINYITEKSYPELTDDFVAEKFSAKQGWKTVQEMKDSLRSELNSEAIRTYIQDYLYNNVTVSSPPDSLLQYQENAMLRYYWDYAQNYGITLEEFLVTHVGTTLEEMLVNYAERNAAFIKYTLVIQAIAEDAEITVSEEDVANYYKEEQDVTDYSQYEEDFGMPYLKQIVLDYKIMNYLEERSVLQ